MYTFKPVILLSLVALSSARIYSYENADGSYTIGHTSDSQGQSENSVLALLTKAAGYTTNQNTNNDDYIDFESLVNNEIENNNNNNEHINVDISSSAGKGLLTPHMEILQLIEAFIRLKGQVASRVQDVISDNWEIIRSLYNTFLSKIGKLHTFTLVGIQILRKILVFAATLFGQWQKPDVQLTGQLSTMFNL